MYICGWKSKIADAEKLMSRQLIKGCARHSFRDYEMKKFIISVYSFINTFFTLPETQLVISYGIELILLANS